MKYSATGTSSKADPEGGGATWGPDPIPGKLQVAIGFLSNTGMVTPLEKQLDPMGPLNCFSWVFRTALCEIL